MAVKVVLCLSFISLFWTTWCEELNNTCPSKNESNKCCSGYRKINGRCTACIGFIGDNCETPCPNPTYGFKCTYICNCTSYEECDPYVGCFTNVNNNYIPIEDNTSQSDPFPSPQSYKCSFLMLLVIALSASQIVILIFCVTTLCLKCCTLPPQRSKASHNVTGQSITMQTSKSNTDVSELHFGKKYASRDCGISSDVENKNGTHYHTLQERQLDLSQYPSNHYDICSTTERIKGHAGDDWNVTSLSGMYALPSDSRQDVQKTTVVTLNTAQSSVRPYSLVEHETTQDQGQGVLQNDYFTLKPTNAI